ncbi:MAG: glycoside hydrolase family 113 [Patescibacteria group bacterium]
MGVNELLFLAFVFLVILIALFVLVDGRALEFKDLASDDPGEVPDPSIAPSRKDKTSTPEPKQSVEENLATGFLTPLPTPTLIPSPTATVVQVKDPWDYGEFQAGVSVLVYGNSSDFVQQTQVVLDRLVSLNVTCVSLVFPIFQENWRSVEVFKGDQTLSDRNIELFVYEAHKRGLAVMLRPLMDEASFESDNEWRGSISPIDKEAWFRSYGSLIQSYAKLAEHANVELFCIGAEFTSLEGETKRWERIIGQVRNVYTGKLTYSSNWGIPATEISSSVQFWDSLDFVGVDAFFPLEKAHYNADLDQMLFAWEPYAMQLKDLQERLGKPIVLTELGTTSQLGSHKKPWLWDKEGELNLANQETYYKASCESLRGIVRGIYWWHVTLYPPSDPLQDDSFVFLGKPAEDVVRECYDK